MLAMRLGFNLLGEIYRLFTLSQARSFYRMLARFMMTPIYFTATSFHRQLTRVQSLVFHPQPAKLVMQFGGSEEVPDM
jgi:hypothetical protein